MFHVKVQNLLIYVQHYCTIFTSIVYKQCVFVCVYVCEREKQHGQHQCNQKVPGLMLGHTNVRVRYTMHSHHMVCTLSVYSVTENTVKETVINHQ